MHLAVHEERGELYVANDMDHSILVFRITDQGDAAPTRIIKGTNTGIKNPTSVALDLKNGELWVANMGNHSATVFPLTANGDVGTIADNPGRAGQRGILDDREPGRSGV